MPDFNEADYYTSLKYLHEKQLQVLPVVFMLIASAGCLGGGLPNTQTKAIMEKHHARRNSADSSEVWRKQSNISSLQHQDSQKRKWKSPKVVAYVSRHVHVSSRAPDHLSTSGLLFFSNAM